MKRTTRFKPNLKDITQNALSNWRLILLSSLFAAGIIIGALLVPTDANTVQSSLLGQIVDSFVGIRSDQSAIVTFGNSFLGLVPFFIVAFLSGLSSFGILVIPVVPMFRGLGLGYSMGYLYSFYALKGISYSALLIIPHTVISTIAILFACREAMRLSGMLLKAMLPSGSPVKFWPEFRKYALRFLAFLVLIGIAALIDTLFSISFSRFFLFS